MNILSKADRRWVWVSNRTSVQDGKISVLAVSETILAIGIAIAFVFYLETLVYIAISAAVAPFLLLRTPESKEMGIRWLKSYEFRVRNGFHKLIRQLQKVCLWTIHSWTRWVFFIPAIGLLLSPVCFVPFYPMISLLVSVVIKFCVTFYWVIRRPLHSIYHIPKNWRLLAIQTDAFQPPELVPGYDALPDNYDAQLLDQRVDPDSSFNFSLRYRNALSRAFYKTRMVLQAWKDWDDHSVANNVITIVVTPLFIFSQIVILVPFSILFYIPAILYRYTLKSSTVVYAPLIYISGGFHESKNIDMELDAIKNGIIQRFTLGYALFILIVLNIIPILLYSHLVEYLRELEGEHLIASEPWVRTLLGHFVFIYHWKPVHGARLVSALLTVALVVLADREIRQRRFDRGWNDSKLNWLLRVMKVPRFICATFTTGTGLYILIPYIHVPPVVWEWWAASG